MRDLTQMLTDSDRVIVLRDDAGQSRQERKFVNTYQSFTDKHSKGKAHLRARARDLGYVFDTGRVGLRLATDEIVAFRLRCF